MLTQQAIQAFLYNRRALNRRPKTIDWYEDKLIPFAAFFPDKLPMEPEAIEEFLATIVPPEKDETKHGYYRTLKALYRFTCKRHRLLNPMDLIDPPTRKKKVRPTLTLQEMNRLMAQVNNLRDRVILSLFIDSGPRVGETASLRKQNIFDDYIKVDGKTGQREIPISEETRRLLLALINTNGATDHVFMGQRGSLTRSGIYRIVRNYMRKAGITAPKLGPHRIRHAFGKNFIRNGGDTRSLQEIMGHSNITTTEIYIELSKDEIIAKHHQFTPLRSTHAAAQWSIFDQDKQLALKEAEAILTKKKGG